MPWKSHDQPVKWAGDDGDPSEHAARARRRRRCCEAARQYRDSHRIRVRHQLREVNRQAQHRSARKGNRPLPRSAVHLQCPSDQRRRARRQWSPSSPLRRNRMCSRAPHLPRRGRPRWSSRRRPDDRLTPRNRPHCGRSPRSRAQQCQGYSLPQPTQGYRKHSQ